METLPQKVLSHVTLNETLDVFRHIKLILDISQSAVAFCPVACIVSVVLYRCFLRESSYSLEVHITTDDEDGYQSSISPIKGFLKGELK